MSAHRVAFASAVLGGSRLAAKIVDLLAALVVARLLTPADFGLVAIAISTLTIVQSFTDLPVANALVHGGRMQREELDTAFTMTFMRGLVIALAMVALSWPFGTLFQDARITPMMWVLAIGPLAMGLTSPRMATFAKEVNYTPNAVIQITGKFIAFVLTVVFAWMTRSYWALIVGMVSTYIISSIGSNLAAPYRPRFSLKRFRTLIDFAGWSSLATVVVTLYAQGDRFFVGGVLGKTALGYYVVGTNLVITATWAFASMTIPSMFSGFTRIRDDHRRLISAYLNSQRLMMALMVPIGCGLALLAKPLIALVLGSNWEPVVPVIEVLGPVSAIQMMVVPVESVTMALGQTKAIFLRNLTCFAIAVPAIIGGAMAFGMMGAVVARAVTGLVGVCLNLMLAKRLLGIGVVRQGANVWRSVLSALAMVIVVGAAQAAGPVITPNVTGWAQFIGYALLAAVAYYTCHWLLWLLARKPDGAETFVASALTRILHRMTAFRHTPALDAEKGG